MLENILRTKCTDLGYINLLIMDTDMREHGTKADVKDSECIRIEMAKLNPVTGRMEFLTFLALKTLLIQYLLLQFIIPKY